jgi:hypothetical protein
MTKIRLNGQTFGGLMKTAEIVEMQAGNFEVVVTTRSGYEYQLCLGGDNEAHLMSFDDDVWMPMSSTARRKAIRLLKKAAEMYSEKYEV